MTSYKESHSTQWYRRSYSRKCQQWKIFKEWISTMSWRLFTTLLKNLIEFPLKKLSTKWVGISSLSLTTTMLTPRLAIFLKLLNHYQLSSRYQRWMRFYRCTMRSKMKMNRMLSFVKTFTLLLNGWRTRKYIALWKTLLLIILKLMR